VLLWCHGNAGNIAHRLENLAGLYRIGLSVFLFDYRGYGQSRGTPSEEGLYRDALSAYDYLIHDRHISSKRLIVFGRSLGGAVAGVVGSKRSVAGLILESTFPSIEHVVRSQYWLPFDWLLGSRFDLLSLLPQIHVPILVIHGDRDNIIPLSLGKTVFDNANHPKEWYQVSGAGHNDLYYVGGKPYLRRLHEFISSRMR